MKVIKIVKNYRNGSLTFVELVDSDEEEELKEAAAQICENDSAGHNYGYNYSWSIVTDPLEIAKAVDKCLQAIDRQLISLHKERVEIVNSFSDIIKFEPLV